ncbi:MAG: putative sugar kinase [Acidimicrobiales bacterium]|nr:putative sugar kinase [Acidimicrobiales bacterium]
MANVALFVHRGRVEAIDLARLVTDWLTARGHTQRLTPSDAKLLGWPELACDEERLTDGLDLVVAIGGDGTMLRAVRRAADNDIAVLGINVGQLGYLTEVEPARWEEALTRFLAGQYDIDERMLLSVRIEAEAAAVGGELVHLVLNEVVLEKVSMGHTVRLQVCLDGAFFTDYVADGLIVATPTGSTAYAFSARGPIVAPNHRALMLTPVSPHMLFDRTLVLDPDADVRLVVDGVRPAALSLDGRNIGTLQPGDAIACTAAPRPARLVTFGGRDFHSILKAKFGLNDR